jgi:large subunit ribosomal protein L21
VKLLLRIALLLIAIAAAAAIVCRLRGREVPAPADPEDLAVVSGIGPVYRSRLAEAGITTFAELAAADPPTIIDATGVTPDRAADWIAQAAALAGR